MAHYSEMDFLYSPTNNKEISRQLNQASGGNSYNIFKNKRSYVVYKVKSSNMGPVGSGTQNIKNFLKDNVYNSEVVNTNGQLNNPYINILNYFNHANGTPGAGLKIKAADIAYLRDLGVYPMNRMIILRRFPEGSFVPEDLNEMAVEPISTVIGWIKPDQNFGKIDFNETWGTTNERFDVVIKNILQKYTGGGDKGLDISSLIPVPDFAQGLLFEFYKMMKLTDRSWEAGSVDETYEYYDPNIKSKGVIVDGKVQQTNSAAGTAGTTGTLQSDSSQWGYNKIPVGDPNVLQEGPFRDPEGQNIKSTFSFSLETTYEQKLIGDVDPGSAMLDILDNLYAMGTSNMVFYWGDNSPTIKAAKDAAKGTANSHEAWWSFIKTLMLSFWDALQQLFVKVADYVTAQYNSLSANTASSTGGTFFSSIFNEQTANKAREIAEKLLDSILTSTIAIHRFKLRGSIELMVGGKDSSTPWYLTLGNPYSPWLATNHIIVKSASVETSNEMGFNDQPQWLKATFTLEFSRSLGKQELMRMFNNTFRRTYNIPSEAEKAAINEENMQRLLDDYRNEENVDDGT